MKKINLYRFVVLSIYEAEFITIKELAFRFNISERQVSEIIRDYNKINEDIKIVNDEKGYRLEYKIDREQFLNRLPKSKIIEHLKIIFNLLMKSFDEEVHLSYSLIYNDDVFYLSTIDSTLNFIKHEPLEELLKYDVKSKKYICNLITNYFTKINSTISDEEYFDNELWNIDQQTMERLIVDAHEFATKIIDQLSDENKNTYSYYTIFKYYLIEATTNKCIVEENIKFEFQKYKFDVPTNFDLEVLSTLLLLELELIEIKVEDSSSIEELCEQFKNHYNEITFKPRAGYLSPLLLKLVDKIFFYYYKFIEYVGLEEDNYVFLKLCSLYGSQIVLMADERTKIYKIERVDKETIDQYNCIYKNKITDLTINVLKCDNNEVYNDNKKNLYIKYKDDYSLRYINSILRFKRTKVINLKVDQINFICQMPRSNYAITMKTLKLNYPFINFNFYGEFSILTDVKIHYSFNPTDNYKFLGTYDKFGNFLEI